MPNLRRTLRGLYERVQDLEKDFQDDLDAATTIDAATHQMRKAREFADHVESGISETRSIIDSALSGKLNEEQLGINGLLGKIQQGFGGAAAAGNSKTVSDILEHLDGSDGSEGLFGALATSPAKALSEAAVEVDRLRKRISTHEALASDTIQGLQEHFEALVVESDTHIRDLLTAPLDELQEGIDTFGDDFLESPAQDVIQEVGRLTEAVEAVEALGLSELAQVGELLDAIGTTVSFMKSIDVT